MSALLSFLSRIYSIVYVTTRYGLFLVPPHCPLLTLNQSKKQSQVLPYAICVAEQERRMSQAKDARKKDGRVLSYPNKMIGTALWQGERMQERNRVYSLVVEP
jgi:hypothetical protein